MLAVSLVIKKLHPDIEGLHDTVLQQTLSMSVLPHNKPYMQFLYVPGHWILMSNIGPINDFVVDLYDSMCFNPRIDAINTICNYFHCIIL